MCPFLAALPPEREWDKYGWCTAVRNMYARIVLKPILVIFGQQASCLPGTYRKVRGHDWSFDAITACLSVSKTLRMGPIATFAAKLQFGSSTFAASPSGLVRDTLLLQSSYNSTLPPVFETFVLCRSVTSEKLKNKVHVITS